MEKLNCIEDKNYRCNKAPKNECQSLQYIQKCVSSNMIVSIISKLFDIKILGSFILFFDKLLNHPNNIGDNDNDFDIFFVDLPNGLNLFYNLSLKHIIKSKLSPEDEREIEEGRALNLQSKLAQFPHIDIAVSTLFLYLKDCLYNNDNELLDRLKKRIISKNFKLNERKHVFTINKEADSLKVYQLEVNPIEAALFCSNEQMFYILSYLMCKDERCLPIPSMKKCGIFTKIYTDPEKINKEKLQFSEIDFAQVVQANLTNMHAASMGIKCDEGQEEEPETEEDELETEEDEPETEENNKLSIHFWTSAYSCLEMQLQKKFGTRLSRKIGFGLDEMRSGLTIQGILSALLQSTKGTKQYGQVEKVYVSPLFYTWATAILLYGPNIEQNNQLSLFVSPFLATPNFSFRAQKNKTNIIDKFEKFNFLLTYILMSLNLKLNELRKSPLYENLIEQIKNLIEQIEHLLTLNVNIYTYTEPSKTYDNIENYSFKNEVTLSDEKIELFAKDYIIDQILHFVDKNHNKTIGLEEPILKKENIIDNSNKTINANKTTNDIKGNIHSFIRFVPRTETDIHAVIPNQLMDHFLRKKHTGYSVTGYLFELNYEDEKIINKNITKIRGIPFPKLDNTITSCEVECDFNEPRNCSKKMKNAKGILNLDTMFEKYVTGKKYKKIYSTSENKPIIKQLYRTHKYKVVPTGGTKLQSHRTRRNRK